MIGAVGTELAYAMCMGCPAPKQMINSMCHKLRGAEAFEKGNKCYLDEYKKGNINLICAGCGREFDNPHDLYCADCRYSPDSRYLVCDYCWYSVRECICPELEMEERIALDWLNTYDCDDDCASCWYIGACYSPSEILGEANY